MSNSPGIVGYHSVRLTTPDPAAEMAYERLFGDGAGDEATSGSVTIAAAESVGFEGITFAVNQFEASATLLERRGLDIRLDGARADLDAHGVAIGITEGALRHASAGDIAGLDHVVYVSTNPDRAVATLGARLGLDLRLDRTRIKGLRQLFFRCGDSFLELLVMGDDPAADDSLWGIAWRSNDIEQTHARLTAASIEVSEIRDGRKPGTRVFTVKDHALLVPTIIIESTPKPS